ncbi:MAG: DUF4870 domain-containing protein [Actinomycetota bacterium]|nr:DUF4870 domain-containing protein [Actinomycetota bacterium]
MSQQPYDNPQEPGRAHSEGPGGYPPPPPQGGSGPASTMSPAEERNWALGAHLGSFVAAWIALGLLCPLAVLLVKGNQSGYVRGHAVESLNFQITTLIAAFVSAVLVFIGIGILMLIAVGVLYVVLVILASVAASNGQSYRYPVNLRLVK